MTPSPPPPPGGPPPPTGGAEEAQRAEAVHDEAVAEAGNVAKGSGIAMSGQLVNRGLRLVNTWQLTHALSVSTFGLYTSVTTVVSVLASLAPMGLNSGIILFGSRYQGSGEREKLKGTLLACLGGAMVTGAAASALYLLVGWLWPWSAEKAELGALMPYGALSIAAWAVLLVAVSALRVARDAAAQTSVFNVTLPVLLVGLTVAATGLGFGVKGALIAFGLAHLLTFGEAMVRVYRHYASLLRDASIRASLDLSELLRFSIPESLSSMLFRLTQWMDLLQLTVQSTPDQVGIYRVASSLALLGSVPAAALNTIFNATAAELLYLGKREQLDHVLRLVTRWSTAFGAAVFVGLILGQDLVYAIYADAYAAGASSLIALSVGQLVYTAAMPATTLIPMAGLARLNLLNGAAATLLNLALNAVLIPRYGSLGASFATMSTLILWSLWRVVQVKRMLNCYPFSANTFVLIGGTILGTWVIRLAIAPFGLIVHAAAASLLPVALLALLWRLGGGPDDAVVLEPLTRKVKRLLGRGKKKAG